MAHSSTRPVVLIVDDVPANIQILANLLSDDYRVKVANSGAKALEIAQALPHPDIILLDVVMPNMDGYQVCKQLKANPATHDIPVIFITAADDEQSESQGLELGAIDYIAKPFNLAITKLRVQKHLERKQAKKAVEESNERFSNVFRNSPVAIGIAHSRDGRLIDINTAWLELFGYTRDELLGRAVSEFDVDLSALPLGMLLQTTRQGESLRNKETQIRHKSGGILDILFSADMIAFSGEKHVLIMLSDITARKATERELARYGQHLEDLVVERTRELETAKLKAEQLAQVKSEFLTNMSHEIRTPLNAVLGFAQIGYRDCEGHKAQETFGRILDSGQLLLGIINDILDFSKIEAGKLELEQGIVHPGEIVHSIVDLLISRAQTKGLSLCIELAGNLPCACQGDNLKIAQVLTNLVSNAIKFSEQGEIRLKAARKDDNLVFTVEDMGIGMSQDEMSRLFRPFEQADSTITRRFGGTGLGLAISKRLVEMMGGDIRVTSQVGRGSTFEVRLPLVEANRCSSYAAEAIPTPRLRQETSLCGITILAAEDYELNRVLLEELLAGEGCRLEFVENGRQAVERVRELGATAFDLLLMDVEMPEMDGYEATRQILQLAPDLPVVGLTAHALGETRERCLAAGMVEHISKPFRLASLADVILRHVKGSVPSVQESPKSALSSTHRSTAGPNFPTHIRARQTLVNLADTHDH